MMIKIAISIFILMTSIGIGWAGEKEELQFQKAMLQERIGRLMAEFELTKRDLAIIDSKLAELVQKEKKEIPQKGE